MKNTLFLSRSKKLFVLVFLFLHCLMLNNLYAQGAFKMKVNIPPNIQTGQAITNSIKIFLRIKKPQMADMPAFNNQVVVGNITWGNQAQGSTPIKYKNSILYNPYLTPFQNYENIPDSTNVLLYSREYTQAGEHIISINCQSMVTIQVESGNFLKEIVNWGVVPELKYACFKNNTGLNLVPNNLPASIISCDEMFMGCTSLNHNNIKDWDVQNVTNFKNMFRGCIAFNVDISGWTFNNQITNNKNSKAMFVGFLYNAQSFDNDLSKWCFVFTKLSNFSTNAPIEQPLKKHKQPKWEGDCCPVGATLDVVPGVTTVQFSWTYPEHHPFLKNTKIWIKPKEAKKWVDSAVVDKDIKNHTFENLVRGTVYDYKIITYCDSPGFKTRPPINNDFTTLDGQASLPSCSPTSSLSATVHSPTCVTISWQPVQDVVSYFVQVKPSYIPTWDTLSIYVGGASVSNRTNKTFDDLIPGATYNYRIRGTCSYIMPNPGGNYSTDFSSEGTFTLPNSIALPVFFEENTTEWKMYPNPATDLVNINFHLEADSEISFLVYDLTGRIVQQVRLDGFVGANEMQMNIDNLNTGVYLVKAIYGNTNRVVGRVVKQ